VFIHRMASGPAFGSLYWSRFRKSTEIIGRIVVAVLIDSDIAADGSEIIGRFVTVVANRCS
jgi:hypothetical protein